MTTEYNSVVVELLGVVDGVNKTFYTPSQYVLTTIRVIVNGQVYDKDDTRKGWTEIDSSTVEMDAAPLVGDVLQAFYQDLDSEHLGLKDVIGTPFDPNGVLP
jgi:hypothetical protein